MTKAFKKAAAVVLSAALLTTTAVAILPSATAESSIPNPGNWQYSMAQDFNSTTNAGDGGSDIDYWQSSGKIHRVQWLATDAKGVDGSKAVYVHTAIGTNDNYTDELSVNTTNSGVAGNCTNMTQRMLRPRRRSGFGWISQVPQLRKDSVSTPEFISAIKKST